MCVGESRRWTRPTRVFGVLELVVDAGSEVRVRDLVGLVADHRARRRPRVGERHAVSQLSPVRLVHRAHVLDRQVGDEPQPGVHHLAPRHALPGRQRERVLRAPFVHLAGHRLPGARLSEAGLATVEDDAVTVVGPDHDRLRGRAVQCRREDDGRIERVRAQVQDEPGLRGRRHQRDPAEGVAGRLPGRLRAAPGGRVGATHGVHVVLDAGTRRPCQAQERPRQEKGTCGSHETSHSVRLVTPTRCAAGRPPSSPARRDTAVPRRGTTVKRGEGTGGDRPGQQIDRPGVQEVSREEIADSTQPSPAVRRYMLCRRI